MQDKETKTAACEHVIRELEEHMEKLKILMHTYNHMHAYTHTHKHSYVHTHIICTQEQLESKIRGLMQDKETKTAACEHVIRELEEHMEKLKILMIDAKKKADCVQDAYDECVEQLRR
jgi:hypothetical protein